MNHSLRCLGGLGLFLAASASWASISVGSGGFISIGSGTLDLGGGDLTVDGQFDVASGSVLDAGSVFINNSLDGGTGELQLRGDWINNGTFNAGTGSIVFADSVGNDAQITGDSVFHDLQLLSSAGGAYVLESGSIQQVSDFLAIQGLSGLPVQIESSNPPQIAQLFLEPGGGQDIAFVGVSNVHATGQHLAPDQTNLGGTGNDRGWFGNPLVPLPVPALSVPGLIVLILTLFGVALLRRDRAT